MKTSCWIVGASLMAMAFATTPALADDAPVKPDAAAPSTGNDIVVTAQRRDQTIQDVPLAVSAVSANTLTRMEATSTQGLLRMFPNVSGAQVTGAGAVNYSIRGLQNAETAATFNSPVGTYIDGIYLSRMNSNNFALFDISRIEILRGPQGTLFGRNTTGGAVNVILQPPASHFGASIEGSYGSYNAWMLRGSIDAPIGNNIRTRLSAYGMNEDGWVHNTTTGGHNNAHDGYGVREAVSMDLSPNVTWNLAVDDIHDVNAYIPETQLANGTWTSKSGLGELGSLMSSKLGDIPGNRVYNDTVGVSSHINIDSAIGKIQIISGWRHLHTRLNLDYFNGATTATGYDSLEDSIHDQVSQEANLSGSAFKGLVNYTVGAFYFHEYNDTDFGTALFGKALYDRTYINTTNSYAIYGQLDWHLLSKVTLTTGARFTSDLKKLDYIDNNNPNVPTAAGTANAHVTNAMLLAAGIPLSQSSNVVTPRFALQYEPTHDLSFYASATKGFKSGGWNVRAASVAAGLNSFKPETIWSYEAGMRSQWLDRKLTFNLTGFYGKTDNLQIATANAAASTAAPVFPVGNFSDFESYGMEGEVTVKPVKHLTLFGNWGYDWTKYTNPTAAVLQQQANCLAYLASGATAAAASNCNGGIVTSTGAIAEPLRAPKFTSTLGLTYDMPIASGWQAEPSFSWRHVSSFNVNSAQAANSFDRGYDLITGSIGISNPDKGIRASIGCENCTNTNYLVSVIAGYYYWSPPRRWTARLAFKY